MVRALISRKETNVDHYDDDNRSALYYAIENGHCDIAFSLIPNNEPAKAFELDPQLAVFWYSVQCQHCLLDTVRRWVVANLAHAGREIGQQQCFQRAAQNGFSDVLRQCFYLPGVDFNAPSPVSSAKV